MGSGVGKRENSGPARDPQHRLQKATFDLHQSVSQPLTISDVTKISRYPFYLTEFSRPNRNQRLVQDLFFSGCSQSNSNWSDLCLPSSSAHTALQSSGILLMNAGIAEKANLGFREVRLKSTESVATWWDIPRSPVNLPKGGAINLSTSW
ncbi:hypothetical protein BDZ97DRAFT_1916894 [Flammula alnicola]|nr:hypothetical protein BDZ97DRAFT_1916894 [Flammula alnicola]